MEARQCSKTSRGLVAWFEHWGEAWSASGLGELEEGRGRATCTSLGWVLQTQEALKPHHSDSVSAAVTSRRAFRRRWEAGGKGGGRGRLPGVSKLRPRARLPPPPAAPPTARACLPPPPSAPGPPPRARRCVRGRAEGFRRCGDVLRPAFGGAPTLGGGPRPPGGAPSRPRLLRRPPPAPAGARPASPRRPTPPTAEAAPSAGTLAKRRRGDRPAPVARPRPGGADRGRTPQPRPQRPPWPSARAWCTWAGCRSIPAKANSTTCSTSSGGS